MAAVTAAADVRQFALPSVCAFEPMAALVAWFMIWMELFFTPD
ncbi:hypothetical protein [Rhodococcus opacus]|nr:hypothetical protein [Rhodococcus opacus]MDV6247064.1 hypothetical protein [Rhodococcus opacus]